jgi:hypothetical protein
VSLPTDAKQRKDIPIARGVLDYFPLAIAAVAEVSRLGNEQHNPGQPMHWAREKSSDHADCVARHLIDRGKIDVDKMRHSAKMAWRSLALLELELEEAAAQEAHEARQKVAQPFPMTAADWEAQERLHPWVETRIGAAWVRRD